MSNLMEQAEEMSNMWRERVAYRMAELEAFNQMPPLQRKISFGDYFSCRGELVGYIPTLTEFLQRALEENVADSERDFLTACALYDAQMGWFACEINGPEGTDSAVIHVSMVFPITEQLHNAMTVVGCDAERLNPTDRLGLAAAITTDAEVTEAWVESRTDPDQ